MSTEQESSNELTAEELASLDALAGKPIAKLNKQEIAELKQLMQKQLLLLEGKSEISREDLAKYRRLLTILSSSSAFAAIGAGFGSLGLLGASAAALPVVGLLFPGVGTITGALLGAGFGALLARKLSVKDILKKNDVGNSSS